ncbi:hypothetical protein [Flavobacterium sp. NRK1]|uniref:hypothetical protein n=1 Tax=Flavobacterium sp. NRK1 TaxID=2954929 RepID=UPI0020921487|nr:hypothetical protein [Flavobacterium sp. NRK1]MCO6146740.1 hypothetical protein [Flavobacterium sp. NRK1]
MKSKLFTLAVFITTALCGFAQDKTTLKEAFTKMTDLTNQQEYNALVEVAYPRIFNMVSKEDYIAGIEKKMKGDDYTIYMITTQPSVDYGALQRSETGLFCLINYNIQMKIVPNEKIEAKDQQNEENRFKKLLNTEDVYYNTAENNFDAKNRLLVVAIADESTGNRWTFIDPSSPYANDILDEAVRNALDPNYIPETTTQNNPTINNRKTGVQKLVDEQAAKKAAIYEQTKKKKKQ